jgi:DNA-directed RNA polymerase I, II, and III subunit RPABC3
MSDAQLFEDTFTITSINSQKYDRVSRISCTSTDNLTTFTLDVNTELYPCAVGESLSLALASTLSLDGKDEDAAAGRGGWRDVGMGEHTLANEYDYVCHGKVYRFEEGSTQGNMYENPLFPACISLTNLGYFAGPSLFPSEVFCCTWMARTTSLCP